MAAYLQWRRFVFFDRETVKEPAGPDGGGAGGAKPFALPPGITVCDSGRGSLVFGDILARGSLRRTPSGDLPHLGGFRKCSPFSLLHDAREDTCECVLRG
ncbi:unnamed protein product [Eretmochelys imbricata]